MHTADRPNEKFIPTHYHYLFCHMDLTNSIAQKKVFTIELSGVLKYHGVRYTPFSARYLWLYVQYHDLSTGYVGFSSSFFNANVSLQWQLKSIVPRGDWQWLQEKYGFELGMTSNLVSLDTQRGLYTYISNILNSLKPAMVLCCFT